jgi:hypothetical protein
MFDGVIMGAAGMVATLIGFRVIRFHDSNYENWYQRFGRHFRVLGPILLVCGLVLALSRSGG